MKSRAWMIILTVLVIGSLALNGALIYTVNPDNRQYRMDGTNDYAHHGESGGGIGSVAAGRGYTAMGVLPSTQTSAVVAVYAPTGQHWVVDALLSKYDPVDPERYMNLGAALDMDGVTVVAGCPINVSGNYDRVLAFWRDTNVWYEQAEWTLSASQGFGTAVAVANVDAHVSVPAATVTEPGRMVIIMGTSNCHMVLSKEEHHVPGICGYVEDGIIPGYFGYEAGQSCVGDHFAWFVENCVPADYAAEAEAKGLTLHQLLEAKAARQKPGEHGLVALDWWNGNRSVLVDVDLTGLLIGQTLATKPEDIYRALIEATAYGTRLIIENFESHGVAIKEIVATGGLPDRNKLLMQIYADVTGREVKIAATNQAGALGSAMFGAVAAGRAAGGYDTIEEASAAMARLREESYVPIPEHSAVYDRLYQEYVTLHDYFGRGANDVMKRLKQLRAEVFGGEVEHA